MNTKRWAAGAVALACAMGITRESRAEDCDAIVVDDAGVFGGDAGRVAAAAQGLTNIGATVRVRTILTYGSAGSLDHYEAGLERQCASWRAPDGGTKNSLIVLMVAVQDRETGLYSGDQWRHVVRPSWPQIQSRAMNPRFKDGDFAGGFIAGIQELSRFIGDAERAPAGAAAGVGSVTVVQSQPADLSGCANVGFVFLALLALAFLAWGGVQLQRNRQRRQAAQGSARAAKKAAAARIAELNEQLPLLKVQVDAARGQVSAGDAKRLSDSYADVDATVSSAQVRYGDLGSSASDPDRDGRTTEEYRTAEQGYQVIVRLLEEARQKGDVLTREVQDIARAAAQAPERIAEADAAVATADAAIAEVRSAGWKADDARGVFAGAQKELADAKANLHGKRPAAAEKSAAGAIRLAKDAVTAARGVPKRKADLDERAAALADRIVEVEQAIEHGRQVFARVSAAYAESSWDDIAGNGSQAEACATEARDVHAKAVAAAAMGAQDWTAADAALQKGTAALDQATSLTRAIVALEERLIVAKRDAPNEIESAQADFDRAVAYERQHDADIDDAVKQDLRTAAVRLQEARDALAAPVPDYLVVVQLAQDANRLADTILARCQSEYEQAERLRQRAASALRDARDTVSRAKHYLASHSSDVEHGTRHTLANAESSLAAAELATDAERQLASADQAKSEADSAYRRARSDVQEAENERRRAREAAEARRRSSYASPSPSFGGGFSSHRSGGSSSFGSSGRSGGSSSFGSSGRTGGSSKW